MPVQPVTPWSQPNPFAPNQKMDKIEEISFDTQINGLWYKFIAREMSVNVDDGTGSFGGLYDTATAQFKPIYRRATFSGELIPIPAQPVTLAVDVVINTEPEPEEPRAVAEFRDW